MHDAEIAVRAARGARPTTALLPLPSDTADRLDYSGVSWRADR
jgi:hypothetical protein